MLFFFFFFNDTATTEIYPLPLHDALPIYFRRQSIRPVSGWDGTGGRGRHPAKFPVVAAADRQLARTHVHPRRFRAGGLLPADREELRLLRQRDLYADRASGSHGGSALHA